MSKDDIWTVDKLLPKIKSYTNNTKLAEGSIENKKTGGVPLSEIKLINKADDFSNAVKCKNSRVLIAYKLVDSNAVERSFENYYDNCCLFNNCKCEYEAKYVPYFSYIPNHSELTLPQKQFYLYFRDCARKGIYIKTDFPYLLLYVYELINLDHILDKNDTVNILIWLWRSYRKDFATLDKLFCDWIPDFCFSVNLPVPFSEIGDLICDIQLNIKPFLYNLFIFDYLLGEGHELKENELEFLFRAMALYDYKRTKLYAQNKKFSYLVTKTVKELFTMGLVNKGALNENLFNLKIPSEVKITRQLYGSVPISPKQRKTISIKYVPFLSDDNIKYRFDEILKYIENKLRAFLKIKNNISKINISPFHKEFIDLYINSSDEIIKAASQHHIENEAYKSKTSDNSKTVNSHPVIREININAEEAKKIELSSWETTKKLTDIFTEPDADYIPISLTQTDESFDIAYKEELKAIEKRTPVSGSGDLFWEFASLLDEKEESFMTTALYQGIEEARRCCFAMGAFFEKIVSDINQKAVDTIEDIVFDSDYKLIEDYIEDLKEVFFDPTKK